MGSWGLTAETPLDPTFRFEIDFRKIYLRKFEALGLLLKGRWLQDSISPPRGEFGAPKFDILGSPLTKIKKW